MDVSKALSGPVEIEPLSVLQTIVARPLALQRAHCSKGALQRRGLGVAFHSGVFGVPRESANHALVIVL